MTEEMIEEKFAPGSKEVKDFAKGTMQRHHDYFVGLQKTGKLTDEDNPNFELAMQREQEGQVQPLTVEPPTPSSEKKPKK